MLLCPSCTETLEKNEKHGEGVWQCPGCDTVWFILEIPRPKYLMDKSKQENKKVKPRKHP